MPIVGSLVPRRWEGVIRSVHTSVVNVELPTEPPIFVSLTAFGKDMTDLAIQVSDLGVFERIGACWTSRGKRDPIRVVCSGGAVEIGTTPRPVVIPVADRTEWSGRIAEGVRIDGRRVSAFRRALAEYAAGPAGSNGFAALVRLKGARPEGATQAGDSGDETYNPFLRRALRITSGIDAGAPLHALGNLVGLGPGFTPSGDDFIAGTALAHAAVGSHLPDAVRRAVDGARHRTTTGGGTLLHLVLRERFPSYQLRFLGEVSTDSAVEIDAETVLDHLREHGETSGTDMAAGFCWALTSPGVIGLSGESMYPGAAG